MTILFGIIFLLAFKNLKFRFSVPHDAYLSQETAKQVRGLFTILIFFSHYVSYFTKHNIGKYDSIYMDIRVHLDQAIVVPYLFYSGYGMTVSFLKKGRTYIKSVIRYRIPRVFLSMVAAVTLFLILKIFRGEEINRHQILMSYIFWDSLGNSNWYIFGILGEYFIFFIAFLLGKNTSKGSLFSRLTTITVMTCAFVLWIKSQGKESWWYNTLIMFPVGCWYAVFAKRIGRAVQQSHTTYLKTVIMLSISYCFTFFYRSQGLIWYSLWIIAFMGLVLLITMKFEFNSSVFRFFGSHVFSTYILQRIPMIILTWIGWMNNMPYLSFWIALLCTCLIAVVFDKGTHVIFRRTELLPRQATIHK